MLFNQTKKEKKKKKKSRRKNERKRKEEVEEDEDFKFCSSFIVATNRLFLANLPTLIVWTILHCILNGNRCQNHSVYRR